jgi:hypothetical protein
MAHVASSKAGQIALKINQLTLESQGPSGYLTTEAKQSTQSMKRVAMDPLRIRAIWSPDGTNRRHGVELAQSQSGS